MQVVENIALLREFTSHAREPLVFVPTMGALHQGHAALLQQARQVAGELGTVVASIFLNPTQFNHPTDLELYPRSPSSDQELCKKLHVDVLFSPRVEEIYHPEASISVHEDQLSAALCGKSRPGHFQGVLTIVTKLFNMIDPDVAIFGEKDWQQLILVRRLVRDLNFKVHILSHPTVREQDGLAMSSRNQRLSAQERAVAPQIYRTLQQTRDRVLRGERNLPSLLKQVEAIFRSMPHATIEYITIVHEETLQPLLTLEKSMTPARLFVALHLGNVRLIDNIDLPIHDSKQEQH